MRKEDVISYKIDTSVLKNYVESINSITEPMIQIKAQLNQLTKPMQKELKSINNMSNVIKKLLIKYPNEQAKIFTDTIKQIMDINNGMLSTRMLDPLFFTYECTVFLWNDRRISI